MRKAGLKARLLLARNAIPKTGFFLASIFQLLNVESNVRYARAGGSASGCSANRAMGLSTTGHRNAGGPDVWP
jgi:hypothetical protein